MKQKKIHLIYLKNLEKEKNIKDKKIIEALLNTIEVLEKNKDKLTKNITIFNAKLTGSDALSGGHIRCYFASDNGKSISAICYKAIDTEMGETLLSGIGNRFRLAGKIRANEWNGKRYIQFIIEDIAKE